MNNLNHSGPAERQKSTYNLLVEWLRTAIPNTRCLKLNQNWASNLHDAKYGWTTSTYTLEFRLRTRYMIFAQTHFRILDFLRSAAILSRPTSAIGQSWPPPAGRRLVPNALRVSEMVNAVSIEFALYCTRFLAGQCYFLGKRGYCNGKCWILLSRLHKWFHTCSTHAAPTYLTLSLQLKIAMKGCSNLALNNPNSSPWMAISHGGSYSEQMEQCVLSRL